MSVTETAPDAGLPNEHPLPALSAAGLLPLMWRQLTSMRTALILLFFLAPAGMPGSVFPQRGTNSINFA